MDQDFMVVDSDFPVPDLRFARKVVGPLLHWSDWLETRRGFIMGAGVIFETCFDAMSAQEKMRKSQANFSNKRAFMELPTCERRGL
ncbi:hypothetical protein Y1Q_0021158 [Alligator mississippiensis]|uniref:Uncharacterized protein n=1 Tax=Alligator mississippiensis TaxID=8496 RepID=A0A151MZY4_ALLMI|nr:hypothetical protein Y1Q_0021158 [Alligator mississippiensis]